MGVESAAQIAAIGFAAMCFGAAYYLVKRAETERLMTMPGFSERQAECMVCGTINEVIGPDELIQIDCGHCGRPVQLDDTE